MNQENANLKSLQAARTAWEDSNSSIVKAAVFDPASERITIELNNGAAFSIPARNIQGLEEASPEQLSGVEISPLGLGLRWELLDVDVDVAALQMGIFGTRSWMARLGELGGRVSTPAKADAARLNGILGGRPTSIAKTFWERLAQVGIQRQFVLERLIPLRLAQSWQDANTPKRKEPLIEEIASYVEQIFKVGLSEILGNQPLVLNSTSGGLARFKMPANANEHRASAYVVYAHYLALLALETTKHLPQLPLNSDPIEFGNAIKNQYGSITFENALKHIWSLGITVLPLFDTGLFHGACWRTGGRNVIVLKQISSSESRWLFDLLHEYVHTTEQPGDKEFEVIETSETSIARRESVSEQQASLKAGRIALEDRAEELAQMCVKRATGRLEFLKNAVQAIARQEAVSAPLLANYLAFRLSNDGQNWWGAAANLQDAGDPVGISRSLFLQHARLDVLNELDRNLLERALVSA